MRARIAWAIVGLATIAAILDTVFTAAHRSLLSEATWADHGWPLAPLASVGCALMGALIVSRYPKLLLGWLLCVASLLSVTLAGDAYSLWVLEGGGSGSAYWAHVAAWAGPLLGWPAFTALILVFLIAPDGHLLSRRWWWAVGVTLAGLGLRTLGTLTLPAGDFVPGAEVQGRPLTTGLFMTGSLLVGAGLIASAGSLALRLRRARDDERRQLLWMASSATFLAIGVVVILVVPLLQGEGGTWLAGLPLRLALIAVPLCVAVAVLRHRLLQIDVIVNRALVFALATAFVAAGYVAVVVVVGFAVGGSADGFWPSLLATALVALAFQPLRRRVVGLADRLAFGALAAPYEALADFSRRLGQSPDPTVMLPTVADAVAHAVNASRATALHHVDAGPDRVAVWPSSSVDAVAGSGIEFPVVDRGELLGSITVEMPAGHPLRSRDSQLLADLADQAGMAFRTARLTAELSGRVEALAIRTHQLAESRRRLIDTGDAERSRLEQAIASQVVAHLLPLPHRLREQSSLDALAPRSSWDERLEPLVESVNVALEALREITRGIFPAQLARSGLQTALRSLLARTGSAGLLVMDDSAGRRFDPRVEAAAYFCVAEAARTLGDPVAVKLTAPDDVLDVLVSGTDRGGLAVDHIRDRIEAAGGTLSTTRPDGHTWVEVRASVPVTVA